MDSSFFNFITNTTKDNFLKSRSSIIQHSDYDPYSEDLSEIELLLDENKFQQVVDLSNINILLSPKAHILKSYALSQLGNERDAKSEMIFAQKILEGIKLTGNGSVDLPYIITRISDERDFLRYTEENFISQSLIQHSDKFLDVISTQSGKEIHYDITDCYLQMTKKFSASESSNEPQVSIKKWWKFW